MSQNYRREQHYGKESRDEQIDEDLPVTRDNNDIRLRQAITYVVDRGGSDPTDLFKERVHTINDLILHQYAAKGYAFDHRLYQALRALVKGQLKEFQRATRQGRYEHALYRGEDEELVTSRGGFRTSLSKGKTPVGDEEISSVVLYDSESDKSEQADVSEVVFRYGGPNNEVERLYKYAPPIFPFGETFKIQEWESMKINYDLRESARRKAEDNDKPIIETGVAYDAANYKVGLAIDKWESGTKFKLPKRDLETEQWLERSISGRDLATIVEEFNQGGSVEDQERKGYLPRIFLETIKINTVPGLGGPGSLDDQSAPFDKRSAKKPSSSTTSRFGRPRRDTTRSLQEPTLNHSIQVGKQATGLKSRSRSLTDGRASEKASHARSKSIADTAGKRVSFLRDEFEQSGSSLTTRQQAKSRVQSKNLRQSDVLETGADVATEQKLKRTSKKRKAGTMIDRESPLQAVNFGGEGAKRGTLRSGREFMRKK